MRKTNLNRLSVFRSQKYISAQIIDDRVGKTLAASRGKLKTAALVGEDLAKKARAKKVNRVFFDRRSYRYHGHVKELAEGARKGGLKF
jgi:large subunit ribosomal protein L18